MKLVKTLLPLFTVLSLAPIASAAPSGPVSSGDEALTILMAGNKRYLTETFRHSGHGTQRRGEIAKVQHPVALVLGCADSRVPPELVFDQGLGDLFTVRVAGNVADASVLGSIEYAVGHLDVPLVMVLGHEHCGMVEATLKGGQAEGHLQHLAEAIRPALVSVDKRTGDVLDAAVRANVRYVVQQLKVSKPLLADRIKAGKLKVVGARYDLDTGEVELLSP
ncbi:carbonic anhydrase [bacterium]|nr:carbonic anhydrase [bacterium]